MIKKSIVKIDKEKLAKLNDWFRGNFRKWCKDREAEELVNWAIGELRFIDNNAFLDLYPIDCDSCGKVHYLNKADVIDDKCTTQFEKDKVFAINPCCPYCGKRLIPSKIIKLIDS